MISSNLICSLELSKSATYLKLWDGADMKNNQFTGMSLVANKMLQIKKLEHKKNGRNLYQHNNNTDSVFHSSQSKKTFIHTY